MGSAALISGTISTACLSLIASTLFGLGVAGQVILNVMAKPSVQLGLYGIKHFPPISVSDALDKELISGQKFVTVTCFIPLYMMYMNATMPFGFQTDVMFLMLSYSMFNDPNGITDTVPSRIMRRIAVLKIIAKAIYNLTINRVYYRWHKKIQPCFFADKLSSGDLQRIESEIEEDNERENREEAAAIKDAAYPLVLRFLRRAFRAIDDTTRTWWRELLLCSKIDFSKMFGSSSLYRRVLSTFLLPRAGEYVSTHWLILVPGMNTFLNQFTDTPDESLFLRNILGCAVVVLARELVSFSLNYFRFRQLQSIDVDEDPSDYCRYMAEVYDEGDERQQPH
ncbi:DEKNAAC100693 [Brettanomyces naardenensis]|uniref:DEKNAAC100693 n=1 Tax=Brettanomyces naardenensis TaxID=13370 RepID=A0A448YFS3_BRENA|nr:DEKNAAC100693 [Brettanomyces naardenensis]